MVKTILVSSVLVPVMSLGLFAMPALASHSHGNTTTITNENDATVKNYVDASANTGGNTANGGNGGNVSNSGTGGNGGWGGTIGTGDATTLVSISNKVNTNVADVNTCGCSGRNTLTVSNENDAYVKNRVDANSNTGDNTANGADGGSVSGSSHHHHHSSSSTGGNGGDGGLIGTGNAGTGVEIVNRVNTNITRINPAS